MTKIDRGQSSAARRRFALHYLEMLLAMIAGMFLLGPVWSFVFELLGWSDAMHQTEPHALVMATNMTIGMSLWMRLRRHSWISIWQMAAAMYLPFIVLFVPFWAGILSRDALFVVGHVLMLPAMLGAMFLRPHEYIREHRKRGSTSQEQPELSLRN